MSAKTTTSKLLVAYPSIPNHAAIGTAVYTAVDQFGIGYGAHVTKTGLIGMVSPSVHADDDVVIDWLGTAVHIDEMLDYLRNIADNDVLARNIAVDIARAEGRS